MDQVLSLRPFVPARDFAVSKRFYAGLGFRLSHEGEDVAMLKLGGCSFILQNFYN
jgi:predicted lactoylglutathione lyase